MKYKLYGLSQQSKEELTQIQDQLQKFFVFDSVTQQNPFYSFKVIDTQSFKSIQIYVKHYSQHQFIKVEVYLSDTIQMLKERLEQYLNIPKQYQIIIFNRKRIDQEQNSTIQDNKINNQDKLYVIDGSANFNRKQIKLKINKTCTNMITQIVLNDTSTVNDLYQEIQKITAIESQFFKLCYMGKFLTDKQVRLQQQYIYHNTVLIFTISHRKLLIIRELSEVFQCLSMNITEKEVNEFIEFYENTLLETESHILQKLNFHLTKLCLMFNEEKSQNLEFILEDKFQFEIEEYKNQYMKLIKKGLKQFSEAGWKASGAQFKFLLALILKISNIALADDKLITFEIFFLDYIIFNYHRRFYLFHILQSNQQSKTILETYNNIDKGLKELLNKGNFLHLEKFYGFKLELLKEQLAKLINILFPNAKPINYTKYIELICKNSVSFSSLNKDCLVEIIGEIFLINMNELERFTSNYSEDISLSLLLYLLAIHYPLYQNKLKPNSNKQIQEIKESIQQNIQLIQHSEFLYQLRILLFEPDKIQLDQ